MQVPQAQSPSDFRWLAAWTLHFFFQLQLFRPNKIRRLWTTVHAKVPHVISIFPFFPPRSSAASRSAEWQTPWTGKCFFCSFPSSIRVPQKRVLSSYVTSWWRGEYSDVTIGAFTLHDYFLGSDMVRVAIEANVRRGRCIWQLIWHENERLNTRISHFREKARRQEVELVWLELIAWFFHPFDYCDAQLQVHYGCPRFFPFFFSSKQQHHVC